MELGSEVKKFKVGDKVGVGCMIWSCGKCSACKSNSEQYCSQKILTVNGKYEDGTPTHGGFSSAMVVHQRQALLCHFFFFATSNEWKILKMS